MIIHIAIYKPNAEGISHFKVLDWDSKGNVIESKLKYHIYCGARIAIVDLDFDKLPEPKPVFGKGIVINEVK